MPRRRSGCVSIRDVDWSPSLTDQEVVGYIQDEVGDEGMAMAKYLLEHPHISGVDILETFKERKASEVRKVLYRLMEAHVAHRRAGAALPRACQSHPRLRRHLSGPAPGAACWRPARRRGCRGTAAASRRSP